MTFRSLSLLLPLRGNLARRQRLWATIWHTVRTPLEIVVRIDDDDEEGMAWAETAVPKPVIVRGSRHDGYRSLPKFFNEMARVATGDLLMCGNDDMIFLTPDWPLQILAEANRFPDGIFDIGCMSFPAGAFPFSVVSRKAVDALGFLNDERLTYSDIFLRDVMARFGRARFLPFTQIMHVGQPDAAVDAVKRGVHDDAAEYWALHDRCVNEAVARLEAVA